MDLKERAEATKQYLEKIHWGKAETQKQKHNPEKRTEMEAKITDILYNNKGKYADADWNTDPITMTEIRQIVKRFKKSKAPGPDDITTDLIKELTEENLEEVLDLINECWTAGAIPENMLTARVASLYKKGNPEMIENYRPISLLNTFYKILAAAL